MLSLFRGHKSSDIHILAALPHLPRQPLQNPIELGQRL